MSNINNATSKFFSNVNTNDTNNINNTNNTNNTERSAEKSAVPKESYYNISIRFAKDLEGPMKDEAWRLRSNITQYLNELVRADLKAKGYFPNDGD